MQTNKKAASAAFLFVCLSRLIHPGARQMKGRKLAAILVLFSPLTLIFAGGAA
jgi:hypothetical protein